MIGINIKRIKCAVNSALFAALICVATLVVHIPVPATKGYINIGDCFVILSGVILGPLYGFFAGAVGSALSDVITGCIYFAPATFVIKGVMALICAFAYKKFGKNKNASLIFGAALSEIFMVGGYLLFEYFALGLGAAAVAEIPMNSIQGAAGFIMSLIIFAAIKKNSKLTELFLRGELNEHI